MNKIPRSLTKLYKMLLVINGSHYPSLVSKFVVQNLKLYLTVKNTWNNFFEPSQFKTDKTDKTDFIEKSHSEF